MRSALVTGAVDAGSLDAMVSKTPQRKRMEIAAGRGGASLSEMHYTQCRPEWW
jgi:hypothetical protein